ncbi:hypothetical protein SBV1_1570015 [Verrucomicrobia bacterium]|nr:hypothetical protein SBV1_1570015 [Verrucomicrobiota bacterium]
MRGRDPAGAGILASELMIGGAFLLTTDFVSKGQVRGRVWHLPCGIWAGDMATRKAEGRWLGLVIQMAALIVLLGLVSPQARQTLSEPALIAICFLVVGMIGVLAFAAHRSAIRPQQSKAADPPGCWGASEPGRETRAAAACHDCRSDRTASLD